MTEVTMTSFLETIGTFFTQSVNWLGDVLDVVIASPALTVMVLAMPIVGLKICESSLNRVNSVKLSFETIPSQA